MNESEIKALQEKLTAAEQERDALKKENEGFKAKPAPKEDEDDLADRARKNRKAADDAKAENKRIESAFKFNLGFEDLVRTNKDLLPKSIQDVVATTASESYDSAVQKANAIRAAVAKNFFEVKENVELLTASQRESLAEFLSLTKNGREERAEFVYENLVEPALETLKKISKATELTKAKLGISGGSVGDNAYKEKLMRISKKAHLGERETG